MYHCTQNYRKELCAAQVVSSRKISGWLVVAFERNNIAESVGYSYLKVDSILFGTYIVCLLQCIVANIS